MRFNDLDMCWLRESKKMMAHKDYWNNQRKCWHTKATEGIKENDGSQKLLKKLKKMMVHKGFS